MFLYDTTVTIVYTFNCKMWFAIVIACLSVFEYGSTCNVGHGKYFVVEIRIKQANKNNKNYTDMMSFLIAGI